MSTALDQAHADMDAKYIWLGKVLQSTLSPGIVQMAARDFQAAADHFADVKRETVRGA